MWQWIMDIIYIKFRLLSVYYEILTYCIKNFGEMIDVRISHIRADDSISPFSFESL